MVLVAWHQMLIDAGMGAFCRAFQATAEMLRIGVALRNLIRVGTLECSQAAIRPPRGERENEAVFCAPWHHLGTLSPCAGDGGLGLGRGCLSNGWVTHRATALKVWDAPAVRVYWVLVYAVVPTVIDALDCVSMTSTMLGVVPAPCE